MAAAHDTGSAAPPASPSPYAAQASKSEDRSFLGRHRRAALTTLAGVAAVGFFYYVIPQIAGLGPTLQRLRAGDTGWLAIGVLFEAVSIASEIWLFRGVFSRPGNRIGWRISYQIEMAGGVASKVLATAGAGGVALTVWALHASGIPSAEVANGMVCFEILEYAIYMAALAIGGFGLWFGLFTGPAPIGLTLIPALFGTAAIALVLVMLFVDKPVERRLLAQAERSQGRAQRWWRRAATFPRSLQAGMHAALSMIRRRDPSLIGAIANWAFDIGALWRRYTPLAIGRRVRCPSWAITWARSATRSRSPAASSAWREG